MKVRLLVQVSGSKNGKDWPPVGDVVEVSDEEGAQLCAAAIAEPVAEKSADKAEKAVANPKAETRKESSRG